jgi:hypothetical protein
VAALIAFAATPVAAQMSLDRPLPEPEPLRRDSGPRANPSATERTLHVERVTVPQAAWLRLYFGETSLPAGSFLRIRSLADGEVQVLDAAGLALWSNSSAYFNGDTVEVELVAAPGTRGNRLLLDRVAWEQVAGVPEGGCGICGADDRVPSSEDWAARLLPAGCSAAVFNTDSCMVSAGHCISGGMVVQFKVPNSLSNCNLVNPPVQDQFPVQQFQFSNGGVGEDWSVMRIGDNNVGQSPFERYGKLRPIAVGPPAVGNPLDIWGYGIDSECVKSQTQQHSVGSLTSVGGTFFNHNADATFGNSGSSVLRAAEILGIVTHCPCPNWATRVDHPAFTSARNNLCPTTPANQFAALTGVSVLLGNPAGGNLASLQAADGNFFGVSSVPQGTRQTALSEITATSPLSTVSVLDVKVQVAAQTTGPVFLGIQLFNYDTGQFRSVDFSVVPTSGGTVVRDINDIDNPNAYIDPSGNMRIRVYETARVSEVPAGLTKLIDFVEVSILP